MRICISNKVSGIADVAVLVAQPLYLIKIDTVQQILEGQLKKKKDCSQIIKILDVHTQAKILVSFS